MRSGDLVLSDQHINSIMADTAPFWRPEPLTEVEKVLWQALMEAHHASAHRPNVSTEVLKLVAAGAGDYSKAVSAAVNSIGGFHAPLSQTMSLLRCESPDLLAEKILVEKQMVPGWGSSFVQGNPDPIWEPVDRILRENYPDLFEKIDLVTRVLHNHGKNIFPNPSTYTAASAIAFRMPATVAPFLFISGRLAAWSQIAGGIL